MNRDSAGKAVGSYLKSHMDLYFLAGVVGIFSGAIAVAYRVALNFAGEYRHMFYSYIKNDFNIGKFLILALFIVVISLILGYIIVYIPMVKGSGIPQVKGIIARQMDFTWTRELGTKFFGGVLAIVAGMSLGREGPSVQLGAEVGSGVFKIFKKKDYDKKYLITCGASAGLAAAFGAPLAGVIFAIEEIHKFMSPLLVTCVMISCVLAEFVSKYFFGFSTSFDLRVVDTTYQLRYYFLLIIFAFLMTVLGKLFGDGIVYFQKIYSKIKIKPLYRSIVVITITAAMGLFFAEVTGGGHELAERIIHEEFTYKTLFLLLFLKFVFTLICYSTGIPGGIFLPILVCGAIAGKIYGMFFITIIDDVTPGYEVYFVVLGMAALLTAVVKSPVTSTVLMLEMTGSFSHFFPLVVTCMATFLISEVFHMVPIYDTLLNNMLPKDKKCSGDSDKKVIVRIPVGPDTKCDNICIKEIIWPNKCLVVCIERNEEEIIPKGDTIIMSGDTIVILTDEETANSVTPELLEMGEKCLI